MIFKWVFTTQNGKILPKYLHIWNQLVELVRMRYKVPYLGKVAISPLRAYFISRFNLILYGLGKIMRRILRKIAVNDLGELGDISTLAEPEVVQQIIDKRNQSS